MGKIKITYRPPTSEEVMLFLATGGAYGRINPFKVKKHKNKL